MGSVGTVDELVTSCGATAALLTGFGELDVGTMRAEGDGDGEGLTVAAAG